MLTRYGANVDVTISALVRDGKNPDEKVTHGLIDTGAEESCIDERIARELRMPVVDTISIFRSGETRQHNVYAANVIVHDLRLGVQGRFIGIDFILGDIPQEAILGRTFLEGSGDDLRRDQGRGNAREPDGRILAKLVEGSSGNSPGHHSVAAPRQPEGGPGQRFPWQVAPSSDAAS